jgi:hypothetical protein
MSDSPLPPKAANDANYANAEDAADVAALADVDPEIAELLTFEPAPRKFKRDNGWSPALQRKFIFHLARTGSPRLAAQALGKDRYGIEKVYKAEGADSFRAAWDRAVALFEERTADRLETVHAPFAGTIPPGIDRRRRYAAPPHGFGGEADFDEEEISEEQKWALICNIALKFMRKVAAEREARLAGEIVAADFYLRQITMLETVFDLTASAFGWDAGTALRQVRRGEHSAYEIVSTPFADWLDRSRRLWWAQEGAPERPQHPDARLIAWHSSSEGDYATYVEDNGTGATTSPARGYSEEQWAVMNRDEQLAARQRQFAEDAAEQAEWEAKARRDFESRRDSAR